MIGARPRIRWPLSVFALVGCALMPAPAPARDLARSKGTPGSPFAWRGVIQGQYGPQFSDRQRRRLLRFMGRNGFNAYVHAPKDDPYQRTLWRDPYPPALQAEFAGEQQLATQLGIAWIPNVSPAAAAFSSPGDAPPPGTTTSAPLCFSSATDLAQLLAKFAPFRAAGAHVFMVSFDDVRRTFACDGDRVAYGDGDRAFGLANADLLNRLEAQLKAGDPSARLLTVASDYSGTQDTAYLAGFRERLGPGIDVMWTGETTQSHEFGPAAADAYAGLIGRSPIVWENWTTNDAIVDLYGNPLRVFLGPYARNPALVGQVGGFFFNPANQLDVNFLPLATAGDWMARPRSYRPRAAFLRETRRLAGGQASALRAFAETSYSTSLRPGAEAPTLRRLVRRLLSASTDEARARAAAAVQQQLLLTVHARGRLQRVPRLRPFVHQAQPFLRAARLNAKAGLVATRLLQAQELPAHKRLRALLRRRLRRAQSAPVDTFGKRLAPGFAPNVIDRYAADVRRRDVAWRRNHRRHQQAEHSHGPKHRP